MVRDLKKKVIRENLLEDFLLKLRSMRRREFSKDISQQANGPQQERICGLFVELKGLWDRKATWTVVQDGTRRMAGASLYTTLLYGVGF